MTLMVQLVTFGIVMLAWLAFHRGTAARARVEDDLRRENETDSQTRTRHRLENGFIAIFWIGVIGRARRRLLSRLPAQAPDRDAAGVPVEIPLGSILTPGHRIQRHGEDLLAPELEGVGITPAAVAVSR